MSDEPQSIWKRPIKGWRLFAAWLVILTSLTAFLFCFTLLCFPSSHLPTGVFWLISIGILLLLYIGCFSVRWLCSWLNLKRSLLGLACLATSVGLFYAEENFRGKRAWEKYRRELEARGEQLDFKAFIPKPVPDDQNFAMTPLIQSWFPRQNTGRWEDNYARVETMMADHWGVFVDLVAWSRALEVTNSNQKVKSGRGTEVQQAEPGRLDLESRAKAAPAVLEALKTNEAVFTELRAANRRPFSRYPVDYSLEDPVEILLPHLNSVRAVCRRLQLKACAELAAGRSTEALEDVKLIFFMADSVKGEPILISYLVRIACMYNASQPIWEGLAEHAWSDTQLQELQTRLQQYNFIADVKLPLDAERAAGVKIIDYVKNTGKFEQTGMITSSPAGLANLISRIVPSGWYSMEQLNYCRLYQVQLAGTFDTTTKRVSPSRIAVNFRTFDREFTGGRAGSFIHHRFMAALLMPALNRVIVKAAAAQTVVDQAALACVLERYRLANGQFPEKLEALVPRFISQLPSDAFTGEPYKYRRTDDEPSPSGYGHAGGQFILYSVGWNEKDDGGVPGKALFEEREGDWVWQYPATH